MTNKATCRIVFWNIWHGGGYRAEMIAEQLSAWNPDIVALAEFRGTQPSQSIAQRLHDAGLVHQLSTVNEEEPTWNSLLLASRYETKKVQIEGAPKPDNLWLLAKAEAEPALHIGVILVPLGNQWYDYLDALVNVAIGWPKGPGVIIGDTNCALTGLDEDTADSADFKDRFVAPLAKAGWRDAFRAMHPQENAPTWYSSYGNGFRLDHAYMNVALQRCLTSCNYDWGRKLEGKKLSDHAAILLDLDLGAAANST